MANTFTSLHYHFVFSTKRREPWFEPEWQERIWSYLRGLARGNNLNSRLVGGVRDHVHMLLDVPPTVALSDAVKRIKGNSSVWLKANVPRCLGFAWQDGYGAFTGSTSQIGDVEAYIRGQPEHHRTRTFQEEYRAFLNKLQLDYDERYLWD